MPTQMGGTPFVGELDMILMASVVPSSADEHVHMFLIKAGVLPDSSSGTGLGMHPHSILHSSHDAHGFPGLHSLLPTHLHMVPVSRMSNHAWRLLHGISCPGFDLMTL